MRRLILTAALILGLAAPAWADFDEGLAAAKRGDYATALRELWPNWPSMGVVAKHTLDEVPGRSYC